jgi:hypothetical protein
MTHIIIHYNDGEKKDRLVFKAESPQEALVIAMRELAPEKLWKRGWDKKYCWQEIR